MSRSESCTHCLALRASRTVLGALVARVPCFLPVQARGSWSRSVRERRVCSRPRAHRSAWTVRCPCTSLCCARGGVVRRRIGCPWARRPIAMLAASCRMVLRLGAPQTATTVSAAADETQHVMCWTNATAMACSVTRILITPWSSLYSVVTTHSLGTGPTSRSVPQTRLLSDQLPTTRLMVLAVVRLATGREQPQHRDARANVPRYHASRRHNT